MGILTLSPSSSSSAGLEDGGEVVILDTGSNVSLLLLANGQCGEDAPNFEGVQLRDLAKANI